MKEWGPTIVWMDEFDTLGQVSSDNHSHYQQRVNSLKRNLDGMSDFSHIYLFVGTNYPDKIEKALLSRFQIKIEITLPNLKDRRQIIEILSKEQDIEITTDVIEEFAISTEGYSGRNLRDILITARDLVVTRELAKGTLRAEKRVVTAGDIRTAMEHHGKENESE